MVLAPVRFTAQWHVPIGETRPLTAALHVLMVSARAERGCLGCSLSTDVTDLATVNYAEDWATEEALQEQVRSDRFVSLVSLADNATEPARFAFHLPCGMRGLDYADEVRGPSGRSRRGG